MRRASLAAGAGVLACACSLVVSLDGLSPSGGSGDASVDGPTGLDLDTGVSRSGLRADLTVTFGGYRRGHLLARDDVGDLAVIDIGFGPPLEAWPRLLTEREAARAVPRRGG